MIWIIVTIDFSWSFCSRPGFPNILYRFYCLGEVCYDGTWGVIGMFWRFYGVLWLTGFWMRNAGCVHILLLYRGMRLNALCLLFALHSGIQGESRAARAFPVELRWALSKVPYSWVVHDTQFYLIDLWSGWLAPFLYLLGIVLLVVSL